MKELDLNDFLKPDEDSRCGYAAIVGRPNVGKSTLLNQILGTKLSITAAKPQTTRHQILGIKTVDGGQLVLVDTPGIHLQADKAINRYMNRIARAVLQDVDAVLWVIDAVKWTEEDLALGESLKQAQQPLLIILNKIDQIEQRERLLALAEKMQQNYQPEEILMLSALKGDGVTDLDQKLLHYLPFSRPFFDADQMTDRSERFLASEFIREQIMRNAHKEVPYVSTVEIEAFEHSVKLVRISALIWVERDGQKAILIGQGGKTLKRIGTEARRQLQLLLDKKIHLELWVKVKQGWSNNERALQSLGYTDIN